MNAYYKTNVETTNQAQVLERLLHKRIYRAGQIRFDLNHKHKLLHAVNIKKTETGIIQDCMIELGFDCELVAT
ncbi:hypothetical protein HUK80_00515 [Flavobacterium sp. MAH-1]|uniref:Uncharacterized protein n=1 Tax=Flavobacterium agri TaxID=2743471 RepID=A0A7Y8XYP3_9FLAO|nr:hypothetical protein [Flavobacterium agri]NUY79360.1 hypothetical protein [Flavobacterium agri]NYA69384.1 hypothetical protein [Flavobacterium agri]